MQYYRVNVDKEETVSWRIEYEPIMRELRPLIRARAGLLPRALSQFRIQVDPTERNGGAALELVPPSSRVTRATVSPVAPVIAMIAAAARATRR